MKYSIEIEGNEIIETLEFRNKEYTRNWTKSKYSLKTEDPDFVKQLEDDNIDNEDILINIQDYLSDKYLMKYLLRISKMEKET